MKKEKTEKIVYYTDELSDEFANDTIIAKTIDGTYRYLRENLLGRFLHVFWYRIVAIPAAYVYLKLSFHHKIVNKKIISRARKEGKLKEGFFLYGNHTQQVADAFIPTFVSLPRAAYVIVHPNNVSMPVLGKINPYLGALPLPSDAEATKHFLKAVETRRKTGNAIMIYPEAHIWPYYTDIRPFTDASFRYPAKLSVPVFCFTNTYQKRRLSKKPKIVTYVDGPFYPDQELPGKERKEKLRNQVYSIMKERTSQNNVFMVKYKKREECTETVHEKEE